MAQPIFSAELDNDPEVKTWLAKLSESDRSSLRDDPTPLFKEILGEVRVEDTPEAGDDASGDEMWAELDAAAKESLPEWKYRIFRLWFEGHDKTAIARKLGISRSTVRSALDGIGTSEGAKRGGPGSIGILAKNEEFRRAILRSAMRAIATQKRRIDERALHWFADLQNHPELIEPLSMLLVIDTLAGARREMPLRDLLGYFPRSRVTPCMALLRAYGFASCDGHTIHIHKRPEKK